ncbi:MAG: hypothetical protein ACP5D7_21260 [Limnospira sp.]
MSSETLVVQPIYIAIIASTLFAIIFGLIFKDMLEYQVAVWKEDLNRTKITYKTPNLTVAYLAMSLCVWVSVSTSLAVFFEVNWFSAIAGALVVIPTALLIWFQLGSMFSLWENKGDEAIDLDRFFAGDRERIEAAKSGKKD